MKSALLTASGSGQQRRKRSIPDDESGMQIEDTPETGSGEGTALPAAPSANIRRRIVVKPEPVAVTTQEAVDGHCEKAMRIASVEQIELGNIMELSVTGQVLRWARQSNFLGGVFATESGWMEPEKSQPLDSRQALAWRRCTPACWVVTIRESEERGLCSAELRELLRVVRDQIEEPGVAINNLEEDKCENFAEREEAKIHRC